MKIKEMAVLPLEKLIPHPDAAAFGADAEDRAALSYSVGSLGVLDPLSVVELEEAPGTYWVIDGCGRLDALRAKGRLVAPCVVLDLEGTTPREFAAHRNTMQRKVTTGQRLMCYLSLRQKEALEAAERKRGGDQSKSKVSRETLLSQKTLAAALGCSSVDAHKALELYGEMYADNATEHVQEVFQSVMRGETPVRRWKSALGGMEATKDKPKQVINYGELLTRTLTTLKNCFEHWQEIPIAQREAKLTFWAEALGSLPEDLRRVTAEAAKGE